METIEKKGSNKKIAIITGAIVAIIIAIVAGTFIVQATSANKLRKQLQLAEKYLEDLDYDKALAAYNEAIQIDPRNADAYLGLVEVYIRQNQYDKALEIAQKGYEATSDERLNEKIKMLQSGNVKDSRNNVMKTSYYDGDGKLVACHEYTYNKDNKRASIKATFTDGREPQIINYEYDSDGHLLVGYGGYRNKTYSIFLVKNEYSNGKNVKRIYYKDTTMNEVSNTFTYEYENDLLKAETQYNKDGRVTSQYENTYDSNGKRTRRDSYNMPEHTLRNYYIYEYDSEGKITKMSEFKADGSLESYKIYEGSVTKEYDASGNLVSERKTE